MISRYSSGFFDSAQNDRAVEKSCAGKSIAPQAAIR
jgi:hypothetical protein